MKKITFEELAQYSKWPEILLSKDKFDVRLKTEKEVMREFQSEKWYDLIKFSEQNTDFSLQKIENFHLDPKGKDLFFFNNEFWLATNQEILDYHLILFENTIKPYLDGANALVELGAGFGSKILALAQRDLFSKIPLVALEYTENGQELIKKISHIEGIKISVGGCNFRSLEIDAHLIPENSIIFTSYAAHYVPTMPQNFPNFLLKLKPRVIINFEPFYEHFSTDSIHDVMCRRYMVLNDYTKNLMSVFEANDSIVSILNLTKKCIGTPFLPMSILEWQAK